MLLANLFASFVAAGGAVVGYAQGIASAQGAADVAIGASALAVAIGRRILAKGKPLEIAEACDARSIALKDHLASLPPREAQDKLVDYTRLALDEANEAVRRISEIAGRQRRESEQREKQLLKRIDDLERQVAALLAGADEFEGLRMAFLARIDDLEAQVRSQETAASELAEARDRIAALETRLADARTAAQSATPLAALVSVEVAHAG
jgi:chromosome segregation ATPase